MIKKTFASILMILVFAVPLFAEPPVRDPAHAHYLYGQIRTSIVFEVNIMEEVLPFDLSGSLVQYNDSYTTVATGLRLGTYRLISNNTDIKLAVSHTSLKLKDETVTENNEINYRLYIMTEVGSPGFVSTTGSAVEIAGTSVASNHMVSLVDKYLYLTLDEGSASATSNKVDALVSGTYESTITFELWVR